MENKQELESGEWMADMNLNIIWMNCTTCKAVVQANATGICLGCQMGFTGIPQEDAYPVQKVEENISEEMNSKDADEKPETKSLDACKQAKTRKRVRRKNSKRKKVTKKSKKKEVSDGVQGV